MIKIKLSYLAVFSTLVIVFASCEKVLEYNPSTEILNDKAITTSDDLEKAIYGAYDALQSGNVLGGSYVYYGDLLADDANVKLTNLGNFGTKEIYERRTTVQIGALRNAWTDAYTAINRANNIISVINNGTLEGNFNNAKGEAYAIKAISYFQLLQFFCQPYAVGGDNSGPGVITRDEPTLSGPDGLAKGRSSIENSYGAVVSDLKMAISLLSTKYYYPGRISIFSAKAFLARVLFFKGDYAEASSVASEVINSGIFALQTDTTKLTKVYNVTLAEKTNPEALFLLLNTQKDNSNGIKGNYSALISSSVNPYGGNPTIRVSPNVLALYEATDYRKKFLYAPHKTDPTLWMTKKYDNIVPANPPAICVIRLAEMHLIVAEANLSPGGNGDKAAAYASYAAIRNRAGVDPETEADLTLVKVQEERRRELAFEGDRYTNLKRMKKDIVRYNDQTVTIPYNDPSLIFKLPSEEVSANPLVVQNP